MTAGNCMIVGLLASAAWGQTSDKTFYFAHVDTQQALQEVVSVVRRIGDIRDVSMDAANRSVTVKGTADQVALAAWLAVELDKPGGSTGTRDFAFNDPKAPLARVYYLSYPESPRDLQDVAAAVFVAVQMQRCMGTSQQKAIVIRGSAWQVKAADWLIGLLDRPPGTQPAGAEPPEYRLPDEDRNAESGLLLRVTPLAHLDTPLAMLEVARAIGVLAVTLQPIPIWEQGVLVLRGNDDRLALAARLLQEFEGPAGEGTKEIGAGGASDETVVVTYVDEATPQSLTETAAAIRTGMKLQSVVAFTTRKAIAMRGTEDQLVQARQMVLAGLGK